MLLSSWARPSMLMAMACAPQASFERMSARKTRLAIVEIRGKVVDEASFAQRSDCR